MLTLILTQTRQQSSVSKLMEPELDEELDDDFDSNESDDNWEMPSKKRRRTTMDPAKSPVLPTRTSKRTPRRPCRTATITK